MALAWYVEAARPVAAVLPKPKAALDEISAVLKANATFRPATTIDGTAMHVLFGTVHKTPLVLRERHDLLRGQWVTALSVNADDVYAFNMRVEPLDDGKSLRLVPTDTASRLPVEKLPPPPIELIFTTSINGVPFSTLDYSYLSAQFADIPDSQLSLLVNFDRAALPEDTAVVDNLRFSRSSATQRWQLDTFELYIKSNKPLDRAEIGGSQESCVRLVDLAHPKRHVECSRHPVPLPAGVVMIEFTARNEDEQVLLYLQNAALMMGFYYEPPWLVRARWQLYNALYPYLRHFYEEVVPKLPGTPSNHDVDVAWRTVEVPRIWADYKRSGKSAVDFFGLAGQQDIRVDTLGVALWGEERSESKGLSLSAHWQEVARQQAEQYGRDDPVVRLINAELAREQLYYRSALEVARLHAEATLGQWAMLLDTNTGSYYETAPGVPIVYSQYVLQLHMRLFDQRTPAQFSLPLVADIMPFEGASHAAEAPPPSEVHVYKRVFRAEGEYELLVSAYADPIFVVLRPEVPIVPHHNLQLAGTREDYPAPLYLPYERRNYSVISSTRNKHSLLASAWAFFFGNTATVMPTATPNHLETNGALAATGSLPAFDLTAGWLDTHGVAEPPQQPPQQPPLATEARIDEATAAQACPALAQIVSVLQLNPQDDAERRQEQGLPAEVLVLDARPAAGACNFAVTTQQSVTQDAPIALLRLGNLKEELVDGAEHNSLLLTRDPRPMLKAARQIMFSAASIVTFGHYERVGGGNRVPVLTLVDVEAVATGKQGDERRVQFLLSDGRRVNVRELLAADLEVVNPREAQQNLSATTLRSGYYSFIGNDGDRRHSGVLYLGVLGWRYLARSGMLWVSRRHGYTEAHTSALFRMRLVSIPAPQVQAMMNGLVGRRMHVERQGAAPFDGSVRNVSVGAKFIVEVTEAANDIVINSDTSGQDFWMPATVDLLFPRTGLVSSQQDLDDVFALTAAETTPGQHAQRIGTATVGSFVRTRGISTQVSRVVGVTYGRLTNTELLLHNGVTLNAQSAKVDWVPFPLDAGDRNSTSAMNRGARKVFSDTLQRPSTMQPPGTMAGYSVLGWPASAPALYITEDRLVQDDGVMIVAQDGGRDGVLFLIPMIDLARLPTGDPQPTASLSPILTPQSGFTEVRPWFAYKGFDTLQVWTSATGPSTQYLVEPASKAILAVQYSPWPPVPVYGKWTSATEPDAANRASPPSELWQQAVDFAVYSEHVGLPGTVYTGDWMDYSSSSSGRMPDLLLGATDPRTQLSAPTDSIVLYDWSGDAGSGFARMSAIVRARQRMHTEKAVQPHESPAVPDIYIDYNAVPRARFSDANEAPFPAMPLQARLGSGESFDKVIDRAAQGATLQLIADELAPVPGAPQAPAPGALPRNWSYTRLVPRAPLMDRTNAELSKIAKEPFDARAAHQMLLYVSGSGPGGTDNRRLLLALYDRTKLGAARVLGATTLHVTSVLRSSDRAGLHQDGVVLDMIDNDDAATHDAIQALRGRARPYVAGGTVSIERDWRERMTYLLQSPLDAGVAPTFIELEVTDAAGAVVQSVSTLGALPVMGTAYNRSSEAIMLLPPYSVSKSTRFGRLPQPRTAATGADVLAPPVVPAQGRIRVTLTTGQRSVALDGGYDLTESYVRSTPHFTLVLIDPNNTANAARVFISAAYRTGTLQVAGVTFQFR